MKTEYTFVDFDEQDEQYPLSPTVEDKIKAGLQKILDECQFVVGSGGTMIPSNELELARGHRGPILKSPSELSFFWWYHIVGGYKLVEPLKGKS